MALPIIIGVIAGVCAAGGIGNGIHGGIKMKSAKDTMEQAEYIQKRANEKLDKCNKDTTRLMDDVGSKELVILSSFTRFCDVMEKIHGRPEFEDNSREEVGLPKCDLEEIKNVSSSATFIVAGMSGMVAGTAGGIAAAGAVTSAVTLWGTASTGTAIASLSGASATNATLAAIGGGSLAAGGGGVAAGTAVLGGVTAGAALLVGGIAINITGCKLSKKADEALSQANSIQENVEKISKLLLEIQLHANKFMTSLDKVNTMYIDYLDKLDYLVNELGKTRWNEFDNLEKVWTQNLGLLVGILYVMCNTNLVIQNEENKTNSVNSEAIENSITSANNAIEKVRENICLYLDSFLPPLRQISELDVNIREMNQKYRNVKSHGVWYYYWPYFVFGWPTSCVLTVMIWFVLVMINAGEKLFTVSLIISLLVAFVIYTGGLILSIILRNKSVKKMHEEKNVLQQSIFVMQEKRDKLYCSICTSMGMIPQKYRYYFAINFFSDSLKKGRVDSMEAAICLYEEQLQNWKKEKNSIGFVAIQQQMENDRYIQTSSNV